METLAMWIAVTVVIVVWEWRYITIQRRISNTWKEVEKMGDRLHDLSKTNIMLNDEIQEHYVIIRSLIERQDKGRTIFMNLEEWSKLIEKEKERIKAETSLPDGEESGPFPNVESLMKKEQGDGC
jgi:hypothetical protein